MYIYIYDYVYIYICVWDDNVVHHWIESGTHRITISSPGIGLRDATGIAINKGTS